MVAVLAPTRQKVPVRMDRDATLMAVEATDDGWVSCDNCLKWRRVAQVPQIMKWYCSDNLDAKYNQCSIPQEMSDAAIDHELNIKGKEDDCVGI